MSNANHTPFCGAGQPSEARQPKAARATRIGVLHLAAGKPTESSLRPRGWMYSPEIREPRQRKRQTAAISPTYGDDDQSGQDKSPCSTHLHHRKTNFTFVYFQNVRLLLDGALANRAHCRFSLMSLTIMSAYARVYNWRRLYPLGQETMSNSRRKFQWIETRKRNGLKREGASD